jgi:NADH:ubiquinone oxidoreductase subunit 2 (subunit N)
MLVTTPLDASQLAWAGAILLLLGEIFALLSMRSLPRLILLSTVAELGYVLLGLGLGGPVGDAGAAMHLGYQAVMRGLLVVTAWWLIRRTGSGLLADLAGSGQRMPVMAMLFGFAMFSVMGLSPFKGSFSKFMILYAAMEQGQWLLAAVGTLASIIAAFYYLRVIQRVCFEAPQTQPLLLAAPNGATIPVVLLTALTVVMSIWPEPFLHQAAVLMGVTELAMLPQFESPWSMLVLVPCRQPSRYTLGASAPRAARPAGNAAGLRHAA